MPTSNELTPRQMREALKLSKQIDALRQRLYSIIGGKGSVPVAREQATANRGQTPKKRTMSPEGRARIAAAARARWAKFRGKGKAAAPAKASAKAAPKKRGGITPEGRARLAAAMKARWAARKKGAPAPNAAAK